MATTLYLRDVAETGITITNKDEFKLSSVRGDGVALVTETTTASGNHIIINTIGVVDLIFLYRVEAVTISGTVSFNIWGLEDVMGANARAAVVVSRYQNDGTFVSDVVAQGNAGHADDVEFVVGTSTAMTWTATPTSTSFSAGDWLAVTIHADAIGTMGAGVATLAYDAASAGVSGDTFVTFTETITAFVAAADRHGGMVRPFFVNQAVPRASSW